MARLNIPAGVRLDRLTEADVAAATSLSTSIGWNQEPADWRRLLVLHPEGAVAARLDGELVGTATLVNYAPVDAAAAKAPVDAAVYAAAVKPPALWWLGMVITSPAVRGQGIGSALTDAALASAGPVPDGVIGLDATEYGAPLYRRRGFETVALIDRWSGTLRAGVSATDTVRLAGAADLAGVTLLDREETGLDRSALLHHLAGEDKASLVIAESDGLPVAYAMVRTGRQNLHVGPVVARDEEALGPLFGFIAGLAAGYPVFVDAVRRPSGPKLFNALGLEAARTLERMARPATPVMPSDAVVAATGFAWG